jgi:hypothetical protein
VLLVLVAAASLLATLFAPAGRSVVPSLVSPGELMRANSWMGMALTFQGTIGPAVGGAVGYGVLVSVYGVGFALGSLVLLRSRATAGVAVFILGLALSGTGGLLTGLAPVLGLAALAQAVAGSGNGLEVVATDTLVQRSVPRSHRGRSLAWSARRPCLAARSPAAWAASWSTSPPPGRPS